ncbi:class E sortase [Solwaraspora sp. WMMD406]|uniref:sortase n=1 Tax=Solwaraspora sp. WMMD406 TaxID=3016095 RepID=UPI00241804E9|nr:class E sortase [Solwaraspora sp. WMMD406]MDG4764961.1 class E sortase [Solwaraspora sp. WMMD406]
MTTTLPPAALSTPPVPDPVRRPEPSDPVGSSLPPQRLTYYLPGTALTILAVVLLGFVVHLTVISHLQYARNQQTAFADFRADLARGTAPVGQTQVEYVDGVAGQEHVVDPGTPVAVLRIPAIDLQTVVVSGTSGETLRQGPGHRRDTVLPGQPGTSVLLGRKGAYGAPFRDLDLLLPGDEIVVVTGQGEHTYRVLGVRRAGDPVPAPLTDGDGRLTLVTADGPRYLPQDLLRVDADLVSEPQPAPPRRFGAAALPASEQAQAGDDAAWTPLMLWCQALFLAGLAVAYLRARWGGWQAWICGLPVFAALGFAATDQIARLLPNLL